EVAVVLSGVAELADSLPAMVQADKALGKARRGAERAQARGEDAKDGASVPWSTQLAALTSYVGVAVAGLSLFQAIFGGGESEHDRILKENSEELRRVALELKGFRLTGSTTSRAREAATRLAASTDALTYARPDQRTRIVEEMLAQFGMTLEELNAVAEANGIRLLDDSGHVIVAAFDDLAQALDATVVRITRFGNSLDEQRRMRELGADLRNEDEPEERINSELALFKQFAPDLFAQFGFEGLDAATEEGRRALDAALLALFEAIEAGALTVEQLGDLEGLSDLESIIAALAGEMDGLREEFDSLSTSIPDGRKLFDLDRQRYDARDVDEAPTAQATPAQAPPPAGPVPPPATTPPAAVPPSTAPAPEVTAILPASALDGLRSVVMGLGVSVEQWAELTAGGTLDLTGAINRLTSEFAARSATLSAVAASAVPSAPGADATLRTALTRLEVGVRGDFSGTVRLEDGRVGDAAETVRRGITDATVKPIMRKIGDVLARDGGPAMQDVASAFRRAG
ncbi:MAG TPA: hypothetical protein VNP72_09945, partial [Longimicrobium sp.]|nr:hypothetical protein [Longimicrobium sp.]